MSPGNASVTGCRDGDGERAERGERCDSGALALALLGELSAFARCTKRFLARCCASSARFRAVSSWSAVTFSSTLISFKI